MTINLCVTVTKRHDLLPGCLQSVFAGTVVPERAYFVDQAGDIGLLRPLLHHVQCPYQVIDLGSKRGCEATAVNWYLENVGEERVIAHEDVVFGPDSLERFVAAKGDFLIDSSLGVITYRDACREKVGLYDPDISPNYFRYVDVDYEDRLAMVGIHPTVIDCGIQHLCNGTMKGLTGAALDDYHRREHLAAINYSAKWGRPVTPGGNTIGRGMWRRAQQQQQVAG